MPPLTRGMFNNSESVCVSYAIVTLGKKLKLLSNKIKIKRQAVSSFECSVSLTTHQGHGTLPS